MDHEDADDQDGDGAQLHVGGEIIARRQQQPHRQHGGDKAVDRHQQRDLVRREGQRASRRESARTSGPPITAAISRTTPTDARARDSDLPPAWLLNIHTPITSAMGIVMPMVNTPHGLLASAFTTTMPSPASVTSRMNSTAIMVTSPANGLISVRAMSASERPLMAHRRHQHGEVLHASGQHRADQQPQESGREAELRRQRRSHQRTGAGDGREMMPEQHPLRRGHVVVPVFVMRAPA